MNDTDLSENVLNEFVHREADVSIDSKHLPQLFLVYSRLYVSVEVVTHHLQHR